MFFQSCHINWYHGYFRVFKTMAIKCSHNWQFYERCKFITTLERIFNKLHTLGNCSIFKTLLKNFKMIFLIFGKPAKPIPEFCHSTFIIACFPGYHVSFWQFDYGLFLQTTLVSNASLKLAKSQADAKHPEGELLPLENYSYMLSSKIMGHIVKNKHMNKCVCIHKRLYDQSW